MAGRTTKNSDSIRLHLQQTIIALRKNQGLSQTQLAEQLGVSRDIVCNLEIGRIHATEELLVKLADFFTVSADQLLGLQPLPEQSPVLSLRLTRRLNKLQSLSPVKQRSVLHTLDLALKGVDPNYENSTEDSD